MIFGGLKMLFGGKPTWDAAARGRLMFRDIKTYFCEFGQGVCSVHIIENFGSRDLAQTG
jgi:hypothetical protein